MLKVESLSYCANNRKILSDINLNLSNGLHILAGKTGSGKTTLLRCIARVLTPEKGSICFNNKDISLCAENIGFMPHRPVVFKELTVKENICFWLDLYKIKNRSESFDLCELFGLAGQLNNVSRHLSRGQAQMLSLVRSLIGKPSILLLDEPTTGLDENSMSLVYKYIIDNYARDSVVVVSTHQPEFLERSASTKISMDEGEGWNETIDNE